MSGAGFVSLEKESNCIVSMKTYGILPMTVSSKENDCASS